MLIIDGKIIETPIRTILDMLQQQLCVMGIDKLSTIDYKATEAFFPCPSHKDGKENNPSCSMALEDKKDCVAGTVYCFTCGYRAGLVKFCADCMGVSYRKACDWILGFAQYSLVEESGRDIDFDIDTEEIKQNTQSQNIEYVSEDELKQYEYIHPYMFQRKLTYPIIEKFNVGYDRKTDALTFPVYVGGKCLFVARRKVSYKRFIMPRMDNKPIYGIDYIDSDEVIVCESVINALTCWVYGKQAVALFGTGSEYQINELKKLNVRKIVLALDGDTAGRKGTEKIKEALSDKIVTVLKVPDGKDINDLSKEEFDALEEEW